MGIGTLANTAVNIYQFIQSINVDFIVEDSPNVISVTAQNFQEEVEKAKLPVVLDAFAPWYLPCHKVAPIFVKLAEELDTQVKFVKLNVDKEPDLAEKLNIKVMPTFLFFKDGKEIHRKEGAVEREYFVDQIELMQKP
jgi:thioredoxin 1